MKKSTVLTVILSVFLGLGNTASAQTMTWASAYGTATESEWGSVLKQTADNGYILAGGHREVDPVSGAEDVDLIMLKLDSSGVLEWESSFGTPVNEDRAESVHETPDGGYLVLGLATDATTGDEIYFLSKVNATGTLQWQKIVNHAETVLWVNKVTINPNGIYLLEGNHWHPGEDGVWDYFYIGLDESGNTVFQSDLGRSSHYWVFDFENTPGGGFAGSGTGFVTEGGSIDMIFREIDTQGNTLQQKSYGYPGRTEWSSALTVTDTGGYMLAGSSTVFDANNKYDVDLCFIRIDAQGSLLWHKVYSAPHREDWTQGLFATSDGGFLVLGIYEDTAAGTWHKILVKVDSQGNMMWQKRLENADTGLIIDYKDVKPTDDGGCIAIGTYESAPGVTSSYLLKISRTGAIQWQRKFGQTGFWVHPIIQTTDDGYILAGSTWDYGSHDDIIVIKLDRNGDIPDLECEITVETGNIRLVDMDYTLSVFEMDVFDNGYQFNDTVVIMQDTPIQNTPLFVETVPICDPVLIELAYFEAAHSADGVVIEWQTASETDNAGFNLYRAESARGPFEKVNAQLIAAQGDAESGAFYQYVDQTAARGKRYFYVLEDIDLNGVTTVHEAVRARRFGR